MRSTASTRNSTSKENTHYLDGPLIDALFFDELAFFLPSARFIETVYLPYAERQKRRSTFLGYRNIWKRYIKPDGDRALREFRTFECEQM